jgi:hypothetical protein
MFNFDVSTVEPSDSNDPELVIFNGMDTDRR